jgi:PAS domain S-box-containing protein
MDRRRSSTPDLRTLEERYRLLVEGIGDYALFLLDADGRVATWNKGAQNIKGWTEKEVVGKPYAVFFPKDAAKAGRPEQLLSIAAAEGRVEDEGWRVRKDGSLFWASAVLTALRGDDGALIGFAKITRDMTERRRNEELLRRSEEALRSALEDLRRANRELEDYAAFVSHDLQEPLRKMASFAELLRLHSGPAVDEKGNAYIARIVEGAERMRRLITDVLDYSRIGRAENAPGPVELDAVVADALSDLEAARQESGAELEVGRLPVVRGNRTLLTRLFQNLLSNAFKFRKEGTALKVRVEARREGGEWHVIVADNGIGFDPAHAQEILRPFRRLHDRERYPGTGLGLAGAKKIVEHHGGRLWASAEPGKGATFHVALPAGGGRRP